MTSEQLNAVEMTRHIRDQMYEETKELGTEDLLRYFKQRGEAATRKVEERETITVEERSRRIRRSNG